MTYVDGFLLPKDKIEDYRKIAEMAAKVWLEHGAVAYKECVGEDVEIPGMVAFPQVIEAKAHETVVFAFIVFNSREHRDEVNAKVMADSRLKDMSPESMPFDCKRMAYGGFRTIVEY